MASLFSYRRTAFALTALGVMSVTAPSAAQQTLPDCSTITESGKRAICEMLRHTEQMKQETKILEVQAQAEAILKKCLAQIADYKKTRPEAFAKLGTITRDNACAVAAKLPKAPAPR
jgi:uncharacterized membrane protein YqiK